MKGSVPMATGTKAVGDMPGVFTGLQGDIMAGAVVQGHEVEVRSRWYQGTLSGALQGLLRLALSLHGAGAENRTCVANVEHGAVSLLLSVLGHLLCKWVLLMILVS